MKIDIAARKRIIEERNQKNLVNQLVNSLKPQEKPDTVTEPLTKVAEGVNRTGNISTISIAFLQSILKLLKEIKDTSPTSSDIRDLKNTIKKLKQSEVDGKNAPELDKTAVTDTIKEIGTDLHKQNSEDLKTVLSPIITAINSLNDNVIVLTKQITILQKKLSGNIE